MQSTSDGRRTARDERKTDVDERTTAVDERRTDVDERSTIVDERRTNVDENMVTRPKREMKVDFRKLNALWNSTSPGEHGLNHQKVHCRRGGVPGQRGQSGQRGGGKKH